MGYFQHVCLFICCVFIDICCVDPVGAAAIRTSLQKSKCVKVETWRKHICWQREAKVSSQTSAPQRSKRNSGRSSRSFSEVVFSFYLFICLFYLESRLCLWATNTKQEVSCGRARGRATFTFLYQRAEKRAQKWHNRVPQFTAEQNNNNKNMFSLLKITSSCEFLPACRPQFHFCTFSQHQPKEGSQAATQIHISSH